MTPSRSGRFEAIARIVLLIVFAAGFLGHCFAQTRPLMLSLTPYLLLGNAFLVLFPLIRERNARVLLWCLTASTCGFLIEATGVRTGVVFGAYSYGTVLGPLLLGVPLLIGLNWALIILGSVELAGRLARGVAPDRLGPEARELVRLPHAAPEFREDGILGCVMFVDHFGNALTNIDAEDLARAFPDVSEPALEVRVLDHTIRGLAHAYGGHPLGTVIAVVGSSGRLEFAQVGGDCATRLGIGEGDRVQVRRLQRAAPAGELEPPRH